LPAPVTMTALFVNRPAICHLLNVRATSFTMFNACR
jgi:hypothetical protein